jgi:hypothetical protein
VRDEQRGHPRSRASPVSRSITAAWVVTSRPVVGSSAISSWRPAGQRDGDHHALAHAARQLERVGVGAPLAGSAIATSRRPGMALARRRARRSPAGARVHRMPAQHVLDLVADAADRVEAPCAGSGRSSLISRPRMSAASLAAAAGRCRRKRALPAVMRAAASDMPSSA